MFTCLKCGRKIKTLYERVFGERPHYEPSGYRCDTCRIFYDAKTSDASGVVYGVARKNGLGGQTAVSDNLERMQMPHESHAVAAQSAYGLEQERMQKSAIAPKIERERTLDHLCVRQVS